MPCRGVLSQHALQAVSQHALQGGSAWGVLLHRGLLGGCLVPGGLLPGGAWWRPPKRLLLRAVRILLECILVSQFFFGIMPGNEIIWTESG